MKQITMRAITFAVLFTLSVSSLALAAGSKGGARHIKVEGKVLEIDRQQRTMLVADQWSPTLYLVNVPEAVTFKITFGIFMGLAEADFSHVRVNNRVLLRCARTEKERYAQLDDGRRALVLIATASR